MMAVVLNVQRQRVSEKEFMLEQPRFGMLDPAYIGVLRHPFVQPLFAQMREGHPAPAAHPAEWEVAVIGEKRPERQPECRTFRVTAIVIGDTLAQVLTAAGVLGGNPDIKERQTIPDVTSVDGDGRRSFAKEPCIDTANCRNDVWRGQNVGSTEQLGMIEKWHRTLASLAPRLG